MLRTSKALEEIEPRACGCSFCRRHRANWYSDSHGQLEVSFGEESDVQRYRFGLKLADFLICKNCGVCVAAIDDNHGSPIAVLNLNSFSPEMDWEARSIPADFDGEDAETRLERRADKWMPVLVES